MQKNVVVLVVFTITVETHLRTSNFDDSVQRYFTVGIYCLNGKLTAV